MLSDGKEKAEAIAKVFKTSGYSTIVETGTSGGETIEWVWKLTHAVYDPDIYTMEIDHAKYLNAIEALVHTDVTPIFASSANHLPRLLDWIAAPCVIFLDAHDTDVNTPSPINAELDHIFYRHIMGHDVIIDDADLFGTGAWPTLESIENLALSHHYSYSVENNLIYLGPA